MDHDDVDKDKDDVDQLDEDGGLDFDDETTGFKIRNPVAKSTARIYTTQQVHALIHEGHIDLNPPYQRDVVWPDSKQIKLIDSIFRNFYIPPVIFAVSKDEDGEDVRVCVDGKQRLTSIQKFFDGQIPHRDIVTKKAYYFTRPDSRRSARLEVPDHFKDAFSAKEITCVEYHGLTPGTEREIFQRVQLGVSLTAAEKLQAIDSPWAEWISDLEARFVASDDGLAQTLQWDTTRGRDFQCIAQVVYCCDGLRSSPPQQLLPTAAKLELFLTRVDAPPPQFKKDIGDVLRAFLHIASEPKLNFGFTKIDKRVAPAEFVFIGVLLYVMRQSPHEDRADAIYALRHNVRDTHVDVRNNKRVGETLWEFIASKPGMPQGSSNGGTSKKKTKRKKGGGDESDDGDEYRPAPVRNLGTTPKTRSANR
ncbi:hypothetical protein PLICRDRAFT_172244 [Plicaturopsis crispa FD-325 SS-3]|nr:hypothetical protein PLICRDRAFT_172244 [Plicaturopsis crispa FD-325 SS-3]